MAVKKDSKSVADEAAEMPEVTELVTEENKTLPKSEESAGDAGSFCVYIGPSIRGVIQSGTIYSESKEKAIASLSAAVKEYPLIANLIVPGETLSEDRVKVRTSGNLLNVYYNRLATSLKSK